MAKLLVVDDEPGIRQFIADVLSDASHAVVQAVNGADALARLAREAFDVVVTDLRMPKVDGLALLAQVRAQQPEAEVIILTAHGSVKSSVDAMRLGAFDFLEKPLESPEALLLVVNHALARRALVAAHDRALRDEGTLPPLTYGDPVMHPVVEALHRVAATNATVLLLGETGVGKEVAARSIHAMSPRVRGPFVTVNCAAISEALLESELFGHEKGAFTGAVTQRRGRIELASAGTFFLDEIGDMKPDLQAKLLRVLQERRFERVGGSRTIEADVRWIAATNRNLETQVANGAFREDLYYRISTFPVWIPPLRDRRKDIPQLADTLLARISRQLGRGPLSLGDEARAWLVESPWPGNVRELANVLERAAILCDSGTIHLQHLDVQSSRAPSGRRTAPKTLELLEQEAIADALRACDGNRREAAERLGIGVRTLYEKLKRYGVNDEMS